jgi:hypothetical protein
MATRVDEGRPLQESDALSAEYGKDPAALVEALGQVDLLRVHLAQFGEMTERCLRRLLAIRRLH